MRSRGRSTRQSFRRWVRGFACSAAALLWLASGCYFAPPPLPGDPSPERPNLNLNGAVPSVFQVLNVSHGDAPVTFTVPFTSIDAGSDIWWFLWANWNLAGAVNEDKNTLTARDPEEDTGLGGATASERSIQFAWTPSQALAPGCNQLTLFVTHAGNADNVLDRPRDISQAAIATFWVNVDAPLDMGQTLVNCPVPSVGP